MPHLDEEENRYSPVTLHLANSEALTTGNTGLYDYNANNEPNFGQKVGYAIGAGLANVAVSFANLGRDLYNIPAKEEDELEQIETGDVLRQYSGKWAQFYEKHEASIDFTSDFASLFIPGTFAVKALGVAKKSNAAIRAAKEVGQVPKYSDRIFGALDIFDTQGKRAAFAMKAAKADAQAPLFSGYNLLRAKHAVLEGLNESFVITSAIALSLNNTSLFDDYQASDFTRDVALGLGLGAAFKFIGTGATVKGERLKNALKYNEENRLSGSFELTPFDERVSRKLTDIKAIKDETVKARALTSALEDFKRMIKSSDKEEGARIYGALDKHLKQLDDTSFNDLWLGTEEIRYFNPNFAEDSKAVFVNTKTGSVRSLPDIVPTAGDLRINIANPRYVKSSKDTSFTLINAGKVENYSDSMFYGDALHARHPAAVEGYRLSVLDRAMRDPRNISVPKELVGAEKYALQGQNFAHLEAGLALAVKSGEPIPFLFGKALKKLNASEIKVVLQANKEKLVRTALDKRLPIEDINLRFGVNTEKMIATNFREGYIGKLPSNADDVARMQQPTHVVGVRKALPPEFSDRATFLSQYDVRAAQHARKVSYKSAIGAYARSILHLDVEQLAPLSPGHATVDSETAKLVFAGGGARYASPVNYAEHNGTVISKAADAAKRSMLDPLRTSSAVISARPDLIAEVSSIAAYARSMPAKLQLVQQADGTGLLFDKVAKMPITRHGTGQPLVIGKEATTFFKQFEESKSRLLMMKNANTQASGRGSLLDPSAFYAPPPNLDKYPHVAFTRSPNGQVRMLYAQTAEQLNEQITAVKTQLPHLEIDTIFDARKKKALFAEYKASSLFDDPEFDFALARAGSAAPLIPRTDTSVVGDMLQWLADETDKTVRTVARNVMSDELNELQFMGDRLAALEATVGHAGDNVLRKGNAFHDIIKTALNYSKYDEYIAVKNVNKTFEQIYSKSIGAMRRTWVDSFGQGKYEQAQAAIAKHFKDTGQQFDYSNIANIMLAGRQTTTEALSKTVNTFNGAIATLALGLDMLHPIVNAIGYVIVGAPELNSLAKSFGKREALDSALSVIAPQSGIKVPAPAKVMAGVIADMFNKTKREALRTKYKNVSTIDTSVFEAQQSVDELIESMANGPEGAVHKYVSDKIGFIKDWTVVAPNAWMQILAHETADRLVRAAGMTDEAQIAAVRSQMSKRINGNYTSSQRGALLQGPLGHAIGLFQTWTLGVAQNMLRYVENKEYVNLATFLGSQTAMFGLQSNPAFQLLNQHLAARDKDNEGLYQKYTDLGEFGDFLLYGVPSASLGMSLYTRGDITPHNPTILPTSLDQVPAINAIMRVYGASAGAFKKTLSDADAQGLSAFGNVGETFASAIALSGLNRPAAGLASVINGYSQTTAGGIGGQIIDPDIVDWSAWTRIVGSRPLSEQKVLDAYYRNASVEAADQEKAQTIGATIRARVASGEEPTSEEYRNFAAQYIEAGGNPAGVRQFLVRQIMLAKMPLAERMYNRIHSDNDLREWRALLGAYEAPGE